MRIGVCDDEKNIRELIGNKLRRECPEAEVVFYASGEELLIQKERIDILFLDIQMTGANGMEIAARLQKGQKVGTLIFVTAFQEYVFQAFDVGAFHYLVKPFSDEKFTEVLKKAIRHQQNGRQEKSCGEEKSIVIKNGRVHTRVLLDHIVYAEVFNRKVVIHKMDGDLEYYGKMSELEKLAGEAFFRSHRAYLVNLKYVEKYDASVIWLERGTALLAKQKFPEFVKQYMRYIRRKE